MGIYYYNVKIYLILCLLVKLALLTWGCGLFLVVVFLVLNVCGSDPLDNDMSIDVIRDKCSGFHTSSWQTEWNFG
jgi:hypothetical protein